MKITSTLLALFVTCFLWQLNAQTPPVITCNANVLRDADLGSCNAMVNYLDATAIDPDSGSALTTTLISGLPSGSAFPVGVNTIVYSASDADGTSTCSFTITITDNENPVINCVADGTRNVDAGACDYTIVGTEFDATFTDNCSGATITNDLNASASLAGEVLSFGDTSVTWTVVDGNGQTASCTTVITIEDNEVPIISCPLDDLRKTDIGSCSYAVVGTEFDATFTDNCTLASISNDLNASTSLEGEMLPLGTTSVTWTVVDGNGQTATCTTIITIEDDEDPVISCVADNSRDVDAGSCTYTVVGTEFDATFTDNCTGATITNDLNGSSSVAGEVLPLGDTTVTWTVDDGNGQTATCASVITVEDNEDPVISCVADDSRDVDAGSCTYTVIGTEFDATFTDNCSGSSTISNNLNGTSSIAGEVLPIGDTTVIWVIDMTNIGQIISCTTVITVEENEDPVINCIVDDSRDVDTGACSYVVVGTEFDATFTDNCANAIITNDLNNSSSIAGEELPVGETTVTWTVDDGNGQTASCTTVITVEDNTSPTVSCQDITVYVESAGSTTIGSEDIDTGSADDCGILSTSISPDTFDATDIGANTVTLTVTDMNGNISICTSMVTVEINNAPNISCPMDIALVDSDANACGAIVNFADAIAVDPEDGAIPVVQTMGATSGSLFPIGDTIVEFTATDSLGVSVSCQFTITVVDNIEPELICPLDQVVETEPGNQYEVPNYFATGEASATDNCSNPVSILTQNPAPGTLLPNGVHIVTLTAEDEYGNVAVCEFELTSILGLNDNMLDNSISVYPNPASDVIIITNQSNIRLDDVTIYDTNGRLIRTTDTTQIANEMSIDVSKLPTGLYMVVINSGDASTVKRLVKN